MNPPLLQSLIAGRWVGRTPAQTLRSAVNGQPIAHTHAEAIDFGEALHHARGVGLPNLLKLDFQQRAGILKALRCGASDGARAIRSTGGTASETTYRLTVRYMAGVTPSCRVLLDDGRVLGITAVIDLRNQHRYMQFLCRELG